MTEQVTYVGLFDGPNADNQAAALALANAFPDSEVLFAISATAAHPNEKAPPSAIDLDYSWDIQRMHTGRVAGMLGRSGMFNCVYTGLYPRKHMLPIVPHSSHVDHYAYDVMGDANGFGREAVAGDFSQFIARLERTEGPIHVVVGGPFSELPPLQQNPKIAPRIGYIAAQAGFRPAERAIYAEMSFNGDVDMYAALRSYLGPGKKRLVPSDMTRHPSVTFTGHQELVAMGIHPELAEIYTVHRTRAEARHRAAQELRKATGGPPLKDYPDLSIHDLQAVLALRHAQGLEDPDLYTFEPIEAPEVIANMLEASRRYKQRGFHRAITPKTIYQAGYRGGNDSIFGPIPECLVAVGQSGRLYKRRAAELLVTPAR